MPSVKELLAKAATILTKTLHNPDQAWTEAEILLAHILKKDRTWLLAHPESLISSAKARTFSALLTRRQKHEPIAYLIGSAEFFGRRFKTDKRALIPRPETEEMISHALPFIAKDPKRTLVLDIGTGSGVIAINVKAEASRATLLASEVDLKPLTLAKQNARSILKSAKAIQFFRTDLLAPALQKTIVRKANSIQAKHFILLANLPYLPLSDKQKLTKDVVKFEPHTALFAKQEGNVLILKCLQQLKSLLQTLTLPTIAFFEFDPPQAQALQHAAEDLFPTATVSILNDTCDRKRFLKLEIPA